MTWSPGLFVYSDVGLKTQLGFKPPSSDFGVSAEIPMWKRFELQGSASFSPDRKEITDDGHAILTGGTGIFWIKSGIGVSGGAEWGRLWTSQFTETAWAPTVGAVFRSDDEKPGRFYVSYQFPTGCVWATPSNPCTLQSKRSQGPTATQEWQVQSHFRVALQAALYHFCDQSNENEPSIPRTCHWAVTEVVIVRLRMPGWPTTIPHPSFGTTK